MQLGYFLIDAFTDRVFGGNPAAVCPLSAWLPDEILLKMAKEHNQSETAFFVKNGPESYHLRWFTPELEMDLCGHATLASAYVIFEELGFEGSVVRFETMSGALAVRRADGLFEMDFPTRSPVRSELPEIVRSALNIEPKEVWAARDLLLLYENETEVAALRPNAFVLSSFDMGTGGIIATSSSHRADFVSRFFTPNASVFEDPVTGSAHCELAPFWAERLGKTNLRALQISERTGEVFCELRGARTAISGKAVKYAQGDIWL